MYVISIILTAGITTAVILNLQTYLAWRKRWENRPHTDYTSEDPD